MNKLKYAWVRSTLILVIILFASSLFPDKSIDQWNIINLNKILKIVFLLAAIQFIGKLLMSFIGNREGIFISGLMDGLVSSTATTLKMARKTKKSTKKEIFNLSAVFLSATLAMIIEAITFVAIALRPQDFSVLIVFIGPFVATIGLIVWWMKKSSHKKEKADNNLNLDLRSSIKLTTFILIILFFSKVAKEVFGKIGLTAVTGIVSLFEVHGSIIANLQIYQNKGIELSLLGLLISISLLSSYISKIAIVFVYGESYLQKIISYWSLIIIASLIGSWLLFHLIA